MIYVFLANGFEEVEALAPVDMLRRAKLDVTTVGVTGKTVTIDGAKYKCRLLTGGSNHR